MTGTNVVATEAERIERVIEHLTALTFPGSRRKMLIDGVRRAMKGADISDVEAYLGRLKADCGSELLDDLVSEITVGETYFFRDSKQFAVIRDRILPSCLAEQPNRPLRLWSAGCATGEEPYTLAILLREAGLAGSAKILATDLSRTALACAREARYGSWSLRGVPADVVARNFERRSGAGAAVLRADIRELVEFRHLNLAGDAYPSHANGTWGFDLILCRNVFIYFDARSTRRIASRLIDCLAPRGWLLTGAADPLLNWLPSCESIVTPAGLVYRRTSALDTARDGPVAPPFAAQPADPPSRPTPPARKPRSRPGPRSAPPASQRLSPATAGPGAQPASADEGEEPLEPDRDAAHESGVEEAVHAYTIRDYAVAAAAADRLVRRGVGGPELWVLLVRSHANMGDLEAAGRACAAAMDLHRTSAELAYLHGVLLAEGGRAAEAASALRSSLYLDRSLVMAHLALSDVSKRLGDTSGARRSLRNAERVLGGLRPEEIVHASDGESAGRLVVVTRVQLAALDPEAA